MKCGKCFHQHWTSEPRDCTLDGCNCTDYAPYHELQSLEYYQSVISQCEGIFDKVKYLLQAIPELRNFTSDQFLFAYWHYEHNFCPGMVLDIPTYSRLTKHETVSRIKRKVVELHPELGPTSATLLKTKDLKQVAIQEWVTQ